MSKTPTLFDWADAQPVAAAPAPAIEHKAERAPRKRKAAATVDACASPADPRPKVIVFRERRGTLGRWLMRYACPIEGRERALDRKLGLLPPAPIFPFVLPDPLPPDPGEPETPRTRAHS